MTGQNRARLRAVAVVGAVFGIFVVVVVGAALLVRLGGNGSEPARETGDEPLAGTPESDGSGGEVQDPIDAIGSSADDEGSPGSRDEVGAVEAALHAAAAPQRWLYLSDEEIAADVEEMAAPDAASRLADEVVGYISEAREDLRASSSRVWWIVHPLAWRVQYSTSTSATVDVWTLTLLSAPEVALPQTDWHTSTFDLVWADGRWLVEDVRERQGPTPMIGPADQPWEPLDFDDALDGFERVGERASP